MNALRMIIVLAGAFSLVLAVLYSRMSETGADLPQAVADVVPASRSRDPAPLAKEGSRNTRLTTDVSPHAKDAASPPTSPSSGSARTTEGNQERAVVGVEEALAAAHQETDPQRRIEALHFLGEHALQEHLDVLQQIQIQDPVPEVRRAAEHAVHTLMARFIDQPWPGVREEDPFGYMRAAPSPSVH